MRNYACVLAPMTACHMHAVCVVHAACYNDDKCLAFHWSSNSTHCGLKAEGNITVRRLA